MVLKVKEGNKNSNTVILKSYIAPLSKVLAFRFIIIKYRCNVVTTSAYRSNLTRKKMISTDISVDKYWQILSTLCVSDGIYLMIEI